MPNYTVLLINLDLWKITFSQTIPPVIHKYLGITIQRLIYDLKILLKNINLFNWNNF